MNPDASLQIGGIEDPKPGFQRGNVPAGTEQVPR
jgi:hypothetical protein